MVCFCVSVIVAGRKGGSGVNYYCTIVLSVLPLSGFFLHRTKRGNLPPPLQTSYATCTCIYVHDQAAHIHDCLKYSHNTKSMLLAYTFVKSRACLSINLPPLRKFSRKKPDHHTCSCGCDSVTVTRSSAFSLAYSNREYVIGEPSSTSA